MEDSTESITQIPSLDGLQAGTRTNWGKLKREIQACVAFQRKTGSDNYLCDMALYATYLYCLASHARGHLHMTKWNVDYPYQFKAGFTKNPRLGKLELTSLDDQQKFIDCARAFIVERQQWMKKYNILSIFKDLPTDFFMTEDEEIEQDIANLVAKKARLESKGLSTTEIDEQIASLGMMQRFINS